MTAAPDSGRERDPEETRSEGVVINDRRRLDPVTGEVRRPAGDGTPAAAADSTAAATPDDSSGGVPGEGDDRPEEGDSGDDELTTVRALAEGRLSDLQRLQAEYVNYRRRVDRDRDVAREGAVSAVLESLLPVLDDIYLARQHGDLAGPFVSISDKLDAVLVRYGLDRYGEQGEPFDPTVHEALMHTQDDEVEVATVSQVLQPGYRVGERVLRAARVAVAAPPA